MKKGMKKGGGGTGTTAYPRRLRPICPWLTTTSTTGTSACSGGSGIRVLLTMRTERGMGLHPQAPEKGTGVCC